MMKNRTTWMGILGIAGTLVLSGCVTTPERQDHTSTVRLVSDTPVHITVSATPGKGSGKGLIDKSVLGQAEAPSAERRLALLQATTRPSVPTKAMAFAALPDGPLRPAEIKALFTGLEVTTDDTPYEIHHFSHKGGIRGQASGDIMQPPPANGTTHEDEGIWMVSKALLCADWLDWYSGDQICYRVSKRGKEIVLNSENYTIRYEISN